MKKKPYAPLLLALAIAVAAVLVLDRTRAPAAGEDVCILKAGAPAPDEVGAPLRIARA